MLLAGAGLLLRTFVQLRHVDLGFNPDRVLTFDVSLFAVEPRVAGADHRVLRRANRAAPRARAGDRGRRHGVSAASPALIRRRRSMWTAARGAAPGESIQAHYRSVTPDYFAAIGMTVVSGRGLTDRDGGDAPRVAVISETMARQHWPNQNPIGQRLAITIEALRFRRNAPPDLDLPSAMREIVGIVADVKHASVQGDSLSEVYIPFAQHRSVSRASRVRTTGDPLALAADARRAAAALDPAADLERERGFQHRGRVDRAAARSTSCCFVGICRRRARPGACRRLRRPVVFGGAADARDRRAARARRPVARHRGARRRRRDAPGGDRPRDRRRRRARRRRVLSGLLFGVTPTDPIALAGAAALVTIVVAFAACYLPARRAMRIDPIVALRSE